ncbi:MAG: hypothetical protein KDB48_10530 [Solirubrobacterales bacterium]|nr:hypothetical protein [Solirubrobacterales bacterium]HMT06273.1 hypothetical protein [Solirubrobacterales bacterium]
MELRRTSLLLTILLGSLLVVAGCGSDEQDPDLVLDRALTRENLSSFADGPGGPRGGVVSVAALGFGDAVLDQRRLQASPSDVTAIREALGSSDSGLRSLVEGLSLEGDEQIGGVTVNHLSGELAADQLAGALTDAGAGDVGSLAGVRQQGGLDETLADADFDLFVGEADGVIRRLDLTLALDDPGNALPATRIRFSLTPDLVHSATE